MRGKHNGKPTYQCSLYHDRGSNHCSRNTVRQDELIHQIGAAIQSHWARQDILERLKKNLQTKATPKAVKVDVSRLEHRLAVVD